MVFPVSELAIDDQIRHFQNIYLTGQLQSGAIRLDIRYVWRLLLPDQLTFLSGDVTFLEMLCVFHCDSSVCG